MTKREPIDIIKGALLLEKRGKALYESVVKTTEIQGVKHLFEMLVEEEKKHIELLNSQFKHFAKNRDFDDDDLDALPQEPSQDVVSDEIVKDISAAGYESAVVSAALEFEKKAVSYYSEQAKKASSSAEKKLYDWLTRWEKTHMHMLAEIDKDLREAVWYDNQFWPLD